MFPRTKQIVSQHWKAIVAIVGAVLVVVQAAVSDGTIDTTEYIGIGTAFLVAVGVYWVPNEQAPALSPEQFSTEPIPDGTH